MNVAFGLTAFLNGVTRGSLDGIGVYSKELSQALLSHDVHLHPFKFGHEPLTFDDTHQQIDTSYAKHVLKAEFLGLKHHYDAIPCPHVIHAPDHFIPRCANLPVIATVHDLIPFIHPEWSSKKRFQNAKLWLFKKNILSANHIITPSYFSKHDLIERFHIPENKITVTYEGVNPEFFNEIPPERVQSTLERLNIKPGYFLFVGTLQPRKNIERVIKAHSRLSPDLKRAHPLLIVGHQGWACEELMETITQHEANQFVRWLKYLPNDDVKVLLQSALAMTYVSLYEGFGLPLLEAFASRCPVIAAKTTSIPEVAGDAAYLVNPLDIEEIHTAMKTLIDQPNIVIEMKQKGCIQAQKFTWNDCARQTKAVYELFLN
jgi:glycosyltransferase involved in cell wall biosynthesis